MLRAYCPGVETKKSGRSATKKVYDHIRNNREAIRREYGNRLPTEERLAEVLETDRFSVRRALRKLVEDGELHSVRNRGYYLELVRDELEICPATSYHAYCETKGIAPRAEVVDLSICASDVRAAEELRLPPGSEIWNIVFLRYRETLPFSLTRSILPKARTPLLIGHIKETHSLYRSLSDFYDIVPRRIRTVCSAVNAGIEDARLLDVPLSSALLKAESTAVDQNGEPIEYCVTLFRGDVVRLGFALSGESA
jgi:GntR family transcriptional regulator